MTYTYQWENELWWLSRNHGTDPLILLLLLTFSDVNLDISEEWRISLYVVDITLQLDLNWYW